MMRRLAVLGVLCACACTPTASATITDDFDGPDGLIAAEGQSNGLWQVTSGSLYRDDGDGWTESSVFRMVSTERDFGDVVVSAVIQVESLEESSRTPAQDYDGAHIWVRYQSEFELYTVSVARRDGSMIIKKKCPGGPDNGGTYYDLSPVVTDAPIPLGRWQDVTVGVRDRPDGSVQITASRDGFRIEAVDNGVGCAPLHGGGIGIRGDNAELRFDTLVATT